MSNWIGYLFIVIFGLAGGLAVGGGFVAFLVVLDIIPRLAQLARCRQWLKWLEIAVTAGVIYWTLADFYDWIWFAFPLGTAAIGLIAGIFVGMLAAALTEVLNVLPILVKRLKLSNVLVWLLLAMVLGKVGGSLFEWLVYAYID